MLGGKKSEAAPQTVVSAAFWGWIQRCSDLVFIPCHQPLLMLKHIPFYFLLYSGVMLKAAAPFFFSEKYRSTGTRLNWFNP